MSANAREKVLEFIRYFVSAVSSAGLYSSDHKHVLYQSEKAYTSLVRSLNDTEELILMVVDDELIFERIPFDRTMYVNKFIQTLKSKNIEYLQIASSVKHSELHILMTALAGQGDVLDPVQKGGIILKKLERQNSAFDNSEEEPGLPLEAIPTQELMVFRNIQECVDGNKEFSMKGVDEIVHSCVFAVQKKTVSIPYLAPLLALDEYTFTHCTNVCVLNLSQAMALGIHGRLLHDLGVAGFLHDVGKLFVPREIITKPGNLSNAERAIINQHPIKGAHYLLANSAVPKLAVVAAYEHHMHFDGTGYPTPSNPWQQNICSQITAISDVFDALRTRRVYREPVIHEKVAALLANDAGTRFNADLVRNFLVMIKKYRHYTTSEAPRKKSGLEQQLYTDSPSGWLGQGD